MKYVKIRTTVRTFFIICITVQVSITDYNAQVLVYVTARLAVVFGINSASNVGGKIVIVRGAAEHYYYFQPTLRELLIPNTTANRAVTN